MNSKLRPHIYGIDLLLYLQMTVLQQPNQSSGVTGSRPDMIETIARAGIVDHIDGLFIKTHFDPANAKSDQANMLDLKYLK